ncbi:MAG: HD domain-containing protein [Archaeoglobaceae archaeon]|nr:HD domain-containing protein [Archaeoglobaceae archaeon]MCX8152630.1 HD domain-containing protein [Archaeoglobaceae archaeon]MDW8014088.1 HD domain-containing protein [Archaeoglobaceae archaeon]
MYKERTSHDKFHIERVTKLAVYIALKEGANVEIVKKAAELHDLIRDSNDHAAASAREARKILKEQGYSDEFVEAVAHAIEVHSFSAKREPKTLEAKILSDADKLDAIGAVGIARAFMFSGEIGRSLEETLKHFEEKLLKLKDLLYTKTAKELAKRRHKFLLKFYKEMLEELKFTKSDLHGDRGVNRDR